MAINPFLATWPAPISASTPASPTLASAVNIAPATAATQQDKRADFADTIEEINANLQALATNLRFEVNPDLDRLVVSVVDSNSGEVLRTIPNETVIRVAKIVASLQGNIVDTAA